MPAGSNSKKINEKAVCQQSSHRSDVSKLGFGGHSPMVTRLHVLVSDYDTAPVALKRSASLGHESDDLLGDSHGDLQWSLKPNDVLGEPPQRRIGTAEARSVDDQKNPIYISVLYGFINAAIVIPVVMSFASIIYRDEAFADYIPVLTKLTLVSGMVHQLCFSTLSTLPFAVGQVQDAGLIFLSKISASIVHYCQQREYADDVILATVTIGLGIATAILGFSLVVIGHLRLAQYVQLLPTCVIGGYLAYIGWFCGVSGISLMARGGGSDLSIALLTENFHFILPGLLAGIVIYIFIRRIQHMAVLPTCIVVLLILFYVILAVTDTSIQDATNAGWIRVSEPAPVWYHTWDYLQFSKVAWEALPDQSLTLLGMIAVVALSSSLDVAAIELELNGPLDYDAELGMVGISNVVSGLMGGYSGSYIFSQSIFSLRAGIRSRIAGFTLALCELVILMLPFPILSYVPNFFFGSLLVMICVDLMHEWLWQVRHNVTSPEYVICLMSFASIQVVGVEYGIAAGVLLFLAGSKIGLDLGTSASRERNSEIRQSLEIKQDVGSNRRYGTV